MTVYPVKSRGARAPKGIYPSGEAISAKKEGPRGPFHIPHVCALEEGSAVGSTAIDSRQPSARRRRRLALAEYDVRALEICNRDRDLSGLAQDHGTPRKLVGRAL